MSLAAPNTIVLQGNLGDKYDEGICGATDITPGMLIEMHTDSTDQDNMVLKPHATSGQDTNIWVAVEDDFQGRTIDDEYVEDDVVRFHKAQKGDRLYMILNAGETVVLGSADRLVSNGDGTLQVLAGSEKALVRALEPLDLSGGGAVDTRIRVEVI